MLSERAKKESRCLCVCVHVCLCVCVCVHACMCVGETDRQTEYIHVIVCTHYVFGAYQVSG